MSANNQDNYTGIKSQISHHKLMQLPQLEREYCVFLLNTDKPSKVEIKNRIKFFGFKIKCYRESKDLTQEQLANYIGCSQSLICCMEQGILDDIKSSVFHDICTYLSLNMGEWISFFSLKMSNASYQPVSDPETREEVLGREIQRRRLILGLNRAEVAQMMECTPSTIMLLESGRLAGIKLIFLTRIAKVLNSSAENWISYLTGESNFLAVDLPCLDRQSTQILNTLAHLQIKYS